MLSGRKLSDLLVLVPAVLVLIYLLLPTSSLGASAQLALIFGTALLAACLVIAGLLIILVNMMSLWLR